MKLRPLFALIGSFGLFASLALAQNTPLPSFSARSVQTTPDQPDRVGTITRSGSYLRLEFEQDGQRVIQIIHPTEGLTYILYPETRSYVEQQGAIQPEEFVESYAPPCPAPAEEAGLLCNRLGLDVYQSIPVERWHISAPDESQMVILWDPTRKRALRQEMSNSVVVQMTFLENTVIEGRQAEHWVTEISRQGAATQRNEWWYDPELKLVLRETLPGNTLRTLESISTGPVDPTVFIVPDGWQRFTRSDTAQQE